MTETDALLVLNAVEGLTNARIRKLLQRYDSARNVLRLNESNLTESASLSSKIVRNILHFPRDNFLKKEYNLIIKNKVQVISYSDKNYPWQLREIPDYPVVLYVKGSIPEDQKLFIAIVGSRRASLYGRSVSEKFAARFAELGFTVVSGMARGVDTSAHNGALRINGHTTIAVLGCGLTHIYPPENKKLFEDISGAGAVISEFSMETPPIGYNFPRRNRIISGLSLGVIVVEAAERSGALITADFALEQGREVFAVPGKVDNFTSKGVNNLIKQGAKLITCVKDVLEEISVQISEYLREVDSGDCCAVQADDFSGREEAEPEKKNIVKDAGSKKLILSETEETIYSHIAGSPVQVDELINLCNLPAATVTSALMQLEFKRLIKQMPGKIFKRIQAS